MSEKKFSFGSNPSMKEVAPGAAAKFTFAGKPEIIETEWGEKYRFPISLLSHDSYDSFPIKCNWESKSQVAKELHDVYHKKEDTKKYKDYLDAYFKSEWQLTRFDTGAYWIDQL
jgi:hypothetical protein